MVARHALDDGDHALMSFIGAVAWQENCSTDIFREGCGASQ
jgi:hypothetical protein